jgi:hypothetical protein
MKVEYFLIFLVLVFILLVSYMFFVEESFFKEKFNPAITHPGALHGTYTFNDFDPAKISPASLAG